MGSGVWTEKLGSEETRRLIIRVTPHLEILESHGHASELALSGAKMEEAQWWADGL